MLIKRWIFYESDDFEIRLPFYISFSTFWNIFGGLCTQVFHLSACGKRWLEVICVIESKVIQPQPKYKTKKFQNLVRKRLLRDIRWNQKQIGISNCVLLGLITNTITQLNSLFVCFLFVDPGLSVETFFEKDGEAENGGVEFQIGDIDTSVHFYLRLKKISCRVCLLFYWLFGDKI